MSSKMTPREWILWNPTRLIVLGGAALVLLLITGLAISQVANQGAARDAAAVAAHDEAAPTSTKASIGPTLAVPDVGDPGDAAARAVPGGDFELGQADPQTAAAVHDTAQAFTLAWLAGRTADPQQWTATMGELVGEDLAPFIAATPPAALPQATVTGVNVDTDTVTPTSGVATVTLSDATTITVRAALTFQGWRVASYQPGAGQ